jgi:membrane protein YqaA with SNARE-associated domain|tara:strand:+ start:1340 stop:1954 length:615 start_codon:yes stop_codon:yes gene_type:complete
MKKITGSDKSVWGKKGSWLKTKIIPLLVLLLVIAITVSLFILTQRYPEKIEEFESYGYLGVFLISLVSNATVILPVPGILVIFPLAATYNPVLVGLIGATGGVIGEITGYLAGYSGRGMVKTGRMYNRVEGWMKRWGAWAIFVFAVTPFLLLDVAGMVAGALRFSFWKFILVAWVGKSLKYIILMLTVAWGWDAGLRFFDCAGP